MPPLPIKRKLNDGQPPGQPLVSSDASHFPEEPRSNFDQTHESTTGNAMETNKMRKNGKTGNDFNEQLDNMSLRAIAEERVL